VLQNATARPPRCTLVNLSTGEEKACLFNPEALAERVQMNFARGEVFGMSHQPQQYTSTTNRGLPGLQFYLDKIYAREIEPDADIMDFRHFLMAFSAPPAAAADVAHNAPPRLLFVWPGVLSVQTVVLSLEFRYTDFGTDGSVLRYTAAVELEEARDTRQTSEDLRAGTVVELGVIDLTV